MAVVDLRSMLMWPELCHTVGLMLTDRYDRLLCHAPVETSGGRPWTTGAR